MKPNEIKIRLVKVSGSVVVEQKKAVLELDRSIITEKSGFIFRKKHRYIVNTAHIKRNKKGKALIGIDLKTHKSFDLGTGEKIDGELLNTLDFLVDKAYHQANMEIPKMSKWEKIAYLFAGIGLFYLITEILKTIVGRF